MSAQVAGEAIYVLPDGELVSPDDDRHEFLKITGELTPAENRKILHLLRMVVAGEFDILSTVGWTDEERRAFVRSLPEADA
ncbi:hypothetical protein [Luteimonas sp. SDU82]|uniref:hypothetical protein n=1 Tax=Luteimonas sp. SDU82 TaxID=3422592 RepID=UPI003EBDE4AA